MVAHRTSILLAIIALALAGCAVQAADDDKAVYIHLSTPTKEVAQLLEPMKAEIIAELTRAYAAGGYRVVVIDRLRDRDPAAPLMLVTFVHEEDYGKYCDDSRPSRGGCAHQRKGTAYVKIRESDFRRNPVQQERTKRRLILVTVHEVGHLFGMKHPEHNDRSEYPDVMSAVASASLWKEPRPVPNGSPHLSPYGYSLPEQHFIEADRQYLRGIGVRGGRVQAAEYAITVE